MIAHIIFATPVTTPTFGILICTKEELEQIDVKTRKLLTALGCFHRNSDADRLYSDRSKGGGGLNSLFDIFIARLISISQHLKEQAPTNAYLAGGGGGGSLVRVAEELVKCFNIDVTQAEGPKKLSAQTKQNMKDNHLKAWIAKPQHGYLFRTRAAAKDPNECYANAWMKKSSFSAHVEGYLCHSGRGIADQCIKTKRMKDSGISPFCRLWKNNRETIQHVIASCPRMSASM